MAELFKLVGTIAIDVTDATEKINAVITAGDGLESVLNKIGTNAESSIGSKSGFSTAAVWLGNMLTELTNKALELGKSIWNTGFGMNVNMESWAASFKTYLGGDLEAAEALVERLKQFAIDTPLSMQEVMAQATQLLATGTEPDKLIEVLTMLGDVSRGDMSYFSRISTAYWQIMTTGRLLAQDANQLTQAGVPVWQLVADYFNAIERDGRTDWTKGLTKDLASQAALQKNPDLAISGEELYSALLFSTSETGMYFNAMNNAMDTTKGKLEKLNDAFTQFAASLTQPFTDVMGTETLDKMIASFDEFTAWAEENPEVLNNLATALSNVATYGLDAFLGGLQGLLEFWNAHRAEFDSLLVLLGGLALYTKHPAAGVALIATGAGDAYTEAKKQMEEGSPVGQYVTKDPEIQAAVESGTTDDLTGLDWFNYHIAAPLVQFMHNLFPGLVVEPSTIEEPETFGPPTPEWFSVDDAMPGGTSGENSIPALIAAIQAQQAEIQSIPDKIAAAFESGVSGITVTGNITTGNVRLDSGAVVGQLTPMLNLRLGWMNKLSDKG